MVCNFVVGCSNISLLEGRASPTRFIEVGESPHENYSYNTGRFMSEASFISLLRI